MAGFEVSINGRIWVSTEVWCQTLGLEREQGGVELKADWQVVSSHDPRLVPAPRPFRPRPSPGMQQVRVKVHNQIYQNLEYLFHTERARWLPELSDERVQLAEAERERVKALDLIPPEDRDWQLVRGLRPDDAAGSEEHRNALVATSPEGGGFILFSKRRRRLAE